MTGPISNNRTLRLLIIFVVVAVVCILIISPRLSLNNEIYQDSGQHLKKSFTLNNPANFEEKFVSSSNDTVLSPPNCVSNPSPKISTRLNSITDESFYSKNKIVSKPSVLLSLKGGIGNQLFQYACHYAIARKNNWPLYIKMPSEITQNKNREWGILNRDFALDQFHIPLHNWNRVDESWKIQDLVAITDMRMLSGDYPLDKVIQQSGGDYCQSEAFFSSYREELLEYFTQKIEPDLDPLIKKWMKKIDSSIESVAVHIRRGDFIQVDVSVPLSFHRKWMAEILEKLKGKVVEFFLFSDDIKYVEEHLFGAGNDFPDHHPVYIVSDKNTTSLQELFLMSRCKHQIIPDSTFSWWGAYLNKNPDKIVYAAHYKSSAIKVFYPEEDRKSFFLFEFRHIYYPIGWFAKEVDWDSKN